MKKDSKRLSSKKVKMNEAQQAAADRDKISSVLKCNGFMIAHADVGWMTPALLIFYWRLLNIGPFPEIDGGGSLTDFLRRHPEMFFEQRGWFKPVITDRTRAIYELVLNSQNPNGRGRAPLQPTP